MPLPRSFDVFCRVVDNFGDAAVCWRLARGLAALPASVRLWIDDLETLRILAPGLSAEPVQQSEGVELRHLGRASDFGTPADVAVDAFGGGLPQAYARAMARRSPKPLWIVLEYLSAEPWVSAHHGLPSPPPTLPIERYFFFPGFVPGTGGLLREPGLEDRRAAFLAEPAKRSRLWHELGFAAPRSGSIVVSLFGYENFALPRLLGAWAAGDAGTVAAVTSSRLAAGVAAFLGETRAPAPGTALTRDALEVRFLPFVSQERYDELLWCCDWNFVRGEDSVVRATWAERPLVWQLYPQAQQAHLAKLEAFLELYCAELDPAPAHALQGVFRAWNGAADAREIGSDWALLAAERELFERRAGQWAARAARPGDLAMNLAEFCAERVN